MDTPTLDRMPELVRLEQAASWLGRSRQTVRRLINAGTLEARQVTLRPGGRPMTWVLRASLARMAATGDRLPGEGR